MFFTCEVHNKQFPSIQALREHDREFHSKDKPIKKSAKLKKVKDAISRISKNKSATSIQNVVQIEEESIIIISTINQVNEDSDRRLQCHICGYFLASNADLNSHFQTHVTNNTPYNIKKEPVKLEKNSEENNQISDDDVEVTAVIRRTKEVCPFPCRFCNRRFKSQEFLKNHIQSEHCDDPDFRVSDIDDEEHIDTESESSISNKDNGSDSEFVPSPSDDDADKEFGDDITEDNDSIITSSSTSSNIKHGQFDEKPKRVSRNISRVSYKNEKGSIFYTSYLPEGIVKCYFCGYTPHQYLIPQFQNHMWKHTLEKIFSCKVCNKYFRNEKDVLKHEKSHTSSDISDRIYKCNQCSSKFSDSRVLMRHKLTHSSLQNHGCNQCGRKYKRLGDLRRHFVSAHQKGDVFKCKICEKDCRRKDVYLLHMRSCHPGVKIKIPPPPKVSWPKKMKPIRPLSKLHSKSQNYSRLTAELCRLDDLNKD